MEKKFFENPAKNNAKIENKLKILKKLKKIKR